MSINWEGQVVTCTVRDLGAYSKPILGEVNSGFEIDANSIRVVYEESIRIGSEHGYEFKQLVAIPNLPVFAVFKRLPASEFA